MKMGGMEWHDVASMLGAAGAVALALLRTGKKAAEVDDHDERIRSLETSLTTLTDVVHENARLIAVVDERTRGMGASLERIENKLDRTLQP